MHLYRLGRMALTDVAYELLIRKPSKLSFRELAEASKPCGMPFESGGCGQDCASYWTCVQRAIEAIGEDRDR